MDGKRLMPLLIISVIFIFLLPLVSAEEQVATVKNTETLGESSENQPKGIANFEKGYVYFEKEKYEKACPYFYRFIRENSPDVETYEWAEFFLGVSLKKLGYSHAATDILSYLVTRKPNQKIVTYSLEIFENVARTIPFDDELVINKVVCDQEYGFVRGHLADFINYHQGLYDWQHGFYKWGNEHFSKINRDSYYDYKYRYQLARLYLLKNRLEESVITLREIMAADAPDIRDIKDDTRKMLARLLYEKGEYAEADSYYGEIEKDILEQSQNMLERAWVHYRLGHPEKAMGLLYAFEAPSFKNNFTPEYYILKSFIYKSVCHYQSALDVVDGFKEKYGDAIQDIYERGIPEENYPLMLVLLGKENIKKVWAFLDLLYAEKGRIDMFQDPPFCVYLNKLYDVQIEESKTILRSKIKDAYEDMADALLKYEEESNLMAYEIGLDMYKRVYQPHFQEFSNNEENENSSRTGTVVYPFQGEFWNDELADYQVYLPDKCNEMEEWDIFFK